MRRKNGACVLLAALLFSGCAAAPPAAVPTPEVTPPATPATAECPVPVPSAALPEDFLLGVDASCVPALEAGGVRYYDHEGTERDVFAILADNGVNTIRVRVWNDPFDAEGHGYGGGNCDVANAAEIGRRAAEQGLQLLVDFHYSDFWADPGKQMVPKAWQGMTFEEKQQALHDYTAESLKTLTEAGAVIGMVQIGNETNGAFCGERAEDAGGWERIAGLMNAGASAVRELCPGVPVALHFTNPEKSGSYSWYARQLQEQGVDYDVFASSYYPYWHGSLETLARELSAVAEGFGKSVMVAETSYACTDKDSDFHPNTIGAGDGVEGYPMSVPGQAKLLWDVIDTLAHHTTGGMGVCYWEGTWVAAGGGSWEENRELWERCGSGWASSYAGEYDPEDAGRWYGGCAVDNQALFDAGGRATEALKVFAQVRESITTRD